MSPESMMQKLESRNLSMDCNTALESTFDAVGLWILCAYPSPMALSKRDGALKDPPWIPFGFQGGLLHARAEADQGNFMKRKGVF